MNEENRPLITDESVEFEKQQIEFQEIKEIMDHFRGI